MEQYEIIMDGGVWIIWTKLMFVWTKNMKKYEMQIMKSLSNFYEETSYSKNSKKKNQKKNIQPGVEPRI